MHKYITLPLIILLIYSLPLGAQAECGTEVSAASRALMDKQRESIQAYAQAPRLRKSVPIEIPIVTHIFRDSSGGGGLSLPDYYDAIDVLNANFAPAGMIFVDCVDPIFYDDNELFIFEAQTDVPLVQNTIQLPDVINIYVADEVTSNDRRLCGFTYFPGSSRDLVVMADQCFTNGATLSHEMGHYFGLYHTHGKSNCSTVTDELVDGSNCIFAGDDICDTPADPNLRGLDCAELQLNADCEYIGTVVDANGEAYEPMTTNIMSYAPSVCRQLFTQGQYDRIAFFQSTERDYLVCTDFSPPANMYCDSAIVVNCGEQFAGNTGLAVVVDDVVGGACGLVDPPGSRGLWYRYTGADANVTFSLCDAAYDSQIAIYTGGCGALDCVDNNDDFDGCSTGSEISLFAVAGVEYLIYVTGYESASGHFNLEVSCGNDGCEVPTDFRVIDRVPGSLLLGWNTNFGQSYTILSTSLRTGVTTTIPNAIPPYPLLAEECEDYRIQLEYTCSGGSVNRLPAISSVSTFCDDDYCLSSGTTGAGTFITGVTLNNITRFSGDDGGYNLYSDELIELDRFTEYSIRLGGSISVAAAYWTVWIDLNGDGDFEDPDEEILAATQRDTRLNFVSDIFIPDATITGITRLRIALATQPGRTPCTQGGEGEVEDYLINISSPSQPANDFCVNATPISCGNSYFGANTYAASTFNRADCGLSGAAAPGVWYTFVGERNEVTLSLCSNSPFDSRIAVLVGPSCDDVTCVVASDDNCGQAAAATFPTVEGQTYYVYVNGAPGNRGLFTLEMECSPLCPEPAVNRDCPPPMASWPEASQTSYMRFAAPGSTGNLPWLIDGAFTTDLAFASADGEAILVAFPESGTYEICYPTLSGDGCPEYCCSDICIALGDAPSNSTARLQPNLSGIELSLNDANATDVAWSTITTSGAELLSSTTTLVIPLLEDGPCASSSYYCSYTSSDGCYKAFRTEVDACSPTVCGDRIRAESTGAGRFSLTFGDSIQGTSWLVNGIAIPSTPGGGDGSLSIAVQSGTTAEVCATGFDPIQGAIVSCCRNLGSTSLKGATESGHFWSVYPNPTTDNFEIAQSISGQYPDRIELFALDGRVLQRWEVVGQGRFELNQISSGVYYLRLTRDGKAQVDRLIVR